MRQSLLLLALVAACAGPAADPAPVVRGPLASRNQHPLALTLHHPRPRRAVTQPVGSTGAALDLVYSSIYEIRGGPGQLIYLDGETARAAVRIRRGLDPRTDLEVEFAATYASSGFLDSLIREFHSLTGLPNQGREGTDDDQFGMRLRRNGQLLFEVEEDRLQLADIAFAVTHSLRVEEGSGPAVAVRAALELPAGSEARGTSNGELDLSAGVLAERSLGRWSLFGGLDLLLPGTPDAFDGAEVELRKIASAQLGVECRWSDRISLLGQLIWTSPMTRDFTFEEFDREIFDLALGVVWDGPLGARYQAAFEEDVVSATGPDFGLLFGMSWGF